MYKYVYKGYDAANIIVEESNNERVINHDEVRSFIETRYVSPAEACYRLLRVPFTPKLNFYLLIYSLPKILHVWHLLFYYLIRLYSHCVYILLVYLIGLYHPIFRFSKLLVF